VLLENAEGREVLKRYYQRYLALASAGVDLLAAITMTTSGEAIGIARAAETARSRAGSSKKRGSLAHYLVSERPPPRRSTSSPPPA
jgi:hypothetical protein